MTWPLTAAGFQQYVERCIRIDASPQSHRDAFEATLEAIRAPEDEEPEVSPPRANKQLVVKFWEATLWLGVYQHLDLSLDDFIATYKPTGPPSLHSNTVHIKRIAEVWGAGFWHHLRRRRVPVPASPAKNFIETLHKAAGRGVPLIDFAGGLSRWLPRYYASFTTEKRNYWADQLSRGTYVLQRVALVDYLDAVSKEHVVEKADKAGRHHELGSNESEDEDEDEDTNVDNTSLLLSVERPRRDREQPLNNDTDNDDDSALALDSDAPPSRVCSQTPANGESLHDDFDVDLEIFSFSASTEHSLANITMGTQAPAEGFSGRSRSSRCHSEIPASLNGQSHFHHSITSPNLSHTLAGRIAKSKPLRRSPLDDTTLRRQINDTVWQPVLDALTTALSEHYRFAQEARIAQLSLQGAKDAESQLRRDIGQELEWDGTPTVKGLHDERSRRDADRKALVDLQALVGQIRAQVQTASSHNEALLRNRVTIVADVGGMSREILDLQNASKTLHDHAEKLTSAEDYMHEASEKRDAAKGEADKQQAGHEAVLQVMSWDTASQREFLDLL
jgi:hypothetical protein